MHRFSLDLTNKMQENLINLSEDTFAPLTSRLFIFML